VTKNILIVDDSELIRVATRHFLESQPGFKVCGEAVDGIDALEKATHLNPDLIILDIAMPRMNGLQTARELRARMYRVPIILFTWYADAVQPEDAAAAGISAVISKSNPARCKITSRVYLPPHSCRHRTAVTQARSNSISST
jgi:DNA-binding NarL/FixJ family response regulator